MHILATLDVDLGHYYPPFFAPQIGPAIRQFTQTVQDENTVFGKDPKFFRLVHLGDLVLDNQEVKFMKEEVILASGEQIVLALEEENKNKENK